MGNCIQKMKEKREIAQHKQISREIFERPQPTSFKEDTFTRILKLIFD